VRGEAKVNRTLDESPRHRLASLGNPERKHSLLFCFARGWIFSKGKGVFLSGFCPPSIRAVRGASKRTKFWQNYFLGKGFAKTSADLFLNSDVASGGGDPL